jgi:hypothetical protein
MTCSMLQAYGEQVNEPLQVLQVLDIPALVRLMVTGSQMKAHGDW